MKDSDINSNQKTNNRGFYYGWVVLVVCLIVITIGYGGRFSFGVFFKSIEQEFGWSRALTSSVFSAYMILSSLFAVLAGWLADRYSPKIVFMSMGLISLLGFAVASQANLPWHLFLGYSLLVAAGTGPAYAVASATATRWFTRRRGLALGIVTSGVGLSSILIVPLAAYIIADYGWRISYLTIGAIAFVVMIPISLLLKENPGAVPSLPGNIQQASVSPNAADKTGEEFRELSTIQIIKDRNFILIFAIWFFWAFCMFMVTTHVVRHAIDLNISPIEAAYILSVYGFANIPARILMGLSSDRFGKKRSALVCAALMIASMLWLAQSSNLWMLYVFAIVFGAATGGLTPPTLALIGDTFGVRHVGFVFGLLEIGWVLGAAVGPALAGYLFDVTDKYYVAFLFGALAALILTVLVIFLKVQEKPAGK